MATPPGSNWRTENERDPLYHPAEIGRWTMLALPLVVVLISAVLVAVSVAVGWAILSVFVYSFAIVAAVGAYVGFSFLWTRFRR